MTTFAFKSAAASLLAVAVLMGCDGDKTSSETEDTTLDDIWVHNTYIKAANAGAVDAFGGAMATDGELMVVAAKGEDSNQLTVTNGSVTLTNSVGSETLVNTHTSDEQRFASIAA
ncbi:MAG: hypothetical protein R3309_11715, partial [Reinekea sp.]|nr:hypothetical protein [Reinekea sp.]